MIKRNHGKVSFECDCCFDVLKTHVEEFQEALAVMREEGWESAKLGHLWNHYCATCAAADA